MLPWIARVKIISLFPKMSSDYALGATIISDGLVGNTKIDPFKGNLSIGKDTIVSTRNFFFGLVPESNLDAWISTSQVKYDTDRLQGTKPGGSYDVFENWKLNDMGFQGPGLHFFFFDWW